MEQIPLTPGGLPKYHQVREELKTRVLDGRLAPGKRLPPERDLMAWGNVSRHTVRMAIGELVREGVLRRERGRGTFVCPPVKARVRRGAAPRRPNQRVGVLMPSLEAGFYARLVGASEAALKLAGYHMVLSNYGAVPAQEQQAMAAMVHDGVRGLLVFPSYNSFMNPYYHELARRRHPLVLLDGPVDGVEADLIACDGFGGARDGVAALLAQGCRRIGFIGGHFTAWTARERLAGFQRGLWEAHRPCPPELIREGPFTREFGCQAVQDLLRAHPDLDGLFIAVHEIAEGAVQGLQRLGRRIPADIRLCTFGEARLPLHDFFPMVTVQMPVAAMAREAVRALVHRLAETKTAGRRRPWLRRLLATSVLVPPLPTDGAPAAAINAE